MLSFGIRFGEGFDRGNLIKLMQSLPIPHDYDFLVVGCNPGGVACAREASQAGKKTAIIKWSRLSPAEEEGFDEDLEEMAAVLEMDTFVNQSSTLQTGDFLESVSQLNSSVKKFKGVNRSSSDYSSLRSSALEGTSVSSQRKAETKSKWTRKVRRSRLDLNNELFKRGHEGRRLMHNAVILQDSIENARNCGWRVTGFLPLLTLNWNKMTEQVTDHVMSENWKLMNELASENVEVIEGKFSFVDHHTVQVISGDKAGQNITADVICAAPRVDYEFPEDVDGAQEFGINCDDFIRLTEPPGKTLVVGSLPEGLECAGIVACCQYPVTVVSRSKILKGYDTEISNIIIEELKQIGVVFLEETNLVSIRLNQEGSRLLVKFSSALPSQSQERMSKKESTEEFDTVLFAVGKKMNLDFMNLENIGVELDPNSGKIITNEYDATTVPNIYAVGDAVAYHPQDFEIAELAGKLLGRRLFREGNDKMDYTMYPTIMFTPTEYAFVGISENAALYRFGVNCIDVFYGHFKPLEFVLPPRAGQCFAKIVVLKDTDMVIGLHLFGPEAGEVIQGFAAAIKFGLTMTKLRTVVGVHTTKAQEFLKLKEMKSTKLDVTSEH